MTAVAAIDADMRRMTRASAACRRLMTIPGVGQLTALAFVAAIDDPSRIRRSRDVGAYLGLVPRRYQSGEVDYVGGISKCGDRRVRTLLYEAAPGTKANSSSRTGPSRSPGDRQCERPGSLWPVASPSSCTRCCGTKPSSLRLRPSIHQTGDRIELPQGATSKGGSRRRRRFCCTRPTPGRLRLQPSRPQPSLPHQAPASAQRTQASQGVETQESLSP